MERLQLQPPLTDEEIVALRALAAERKQKRRVIVGMSGASIMPVGLRLLEVLYLDPQIETHVVVTDGAKEVMREELDMTDKEIQEIIESRADYLYDNSDMGSRISSGSFVTTTEGMIIIPTSVNTLARIACDFDERLIERAAFCTLKEGRKLILVPRETPAPVGYLENMRRAAEKGAQIFLPEPSFYIRPQTIEEIIDFMVGKTLDLFGIKQNLFHRWKDLPEQTIN